MFVHQQLRAEFEALPQGAKQWWSTARRLMQRKGVTTSIPVLRSEGDGWLLDSTNKAYLFVETFAKKCRMPNADIINSMLINKIIFKQQYFGFN